MQHPAIRLYRFRVVLKITAHAELPPFPAPMIYGLLTHANGRGNDCAPVLPEGLLLDAPEHCRIALSPGDLYAFGFTLIAGSQQEADGRLAALTKGLYSLGENAARGVRLGGNFHVQVVQDLVSGQACFAGARAEPIAAERIDAEIAALQDHEALTLRFTSPLRSLRPKSLRTDGHACFDHNCLDLPLLLQRMQGRQRRIGFLTAAADEPDTDLPEQAAELLANSLAWLDFSYGPANDRTSLGGSFGRVRLRVLKPAVIPVLVRAQYVGVGENLNFGFGRFRIEELGPDPTICLRSESLTDLAFRQPAPDHAAARYGLEPGRISELIRDVAAGRYCPEPGQSVWIEQNQRQRLLCIPTKADRALQRCVVDLLAPAVDTFLEQSSLAYRRGLNRERAAVRLRDAWRDGYRWALKADFLKFFDSVPHNLLKDRLDAYINDDELVRLLMTWVRSGAPQEAIGLPTGAVISPLLANLFLDLFDETVETGDRRLIRYADDLMVLFRSEQDAWQVFRDAEAAAAELSLHLNADKTRVLSLTEPFRFLGFEFRPEQGWQAQPAGRPCQIEDLGWSDGAAPENPVLPQQGLPGEQPLAAAADSSLVILGPGIRRLDVADKRLTWQYASSPQAVMGRSMDRISQLIVLGTPTLSGRLLRAVQRQQVSVTLTDGSGRVRSVLTGDRHEANALLVEQQVRAADDQPRRLTIARQLIAAKIHNFAVLADAFPGSAADSSLGLSLRSLEQQLAAADSVESLLGLEGKAAALWYAELPRRLPRRFSFSKRVSPRAADPINVLLNIAHTHLYRQSALILEQVGFEVSVGILHRPKAGFMPLAADLQEVLRHLMERAVLETAQQLQPGDFSKAEHGPFGLVIRPHAVKRLMATIYRLLSQPVCGADDAEPVEYRQQLARTARSLRRYLLGAADAFQAFRQQDVAAAGANS